MDEKIDFVLIWVDSNDPHWKEEKAKYLVKKSADGSAKRFRDWDNLQYWFRGVEKFAPWVRTIHFITCGHYPSWLNRDHPKLHLVKHSDYMAEEYLPTFSTHPIELNLHRIEGLSERFVYFNDDTFIINKVSPSDFFVGGLPCDEALLCPLITKKVNQFDHILLNDMGVLNENYSKKSAIKKNPAKWFTMKYGIKSSLRNLLFMSSFGDAFPFFRIKHLPAPFLKSTLEDVWDHAEVYLDETSRRKFRDIQDVNQYLFRYWQLATGKFHPVNIECLGKNFSLPGKAEELYDAIDKQSFKMICANETEDFEDFDAMAAELKKHFDNLLTKKSSFEV